MSLAATLYEHLDQVPGDDWRQVVSIDVNPILQRGLRVVAKLAFPPVDAAGQHNVFAAPRPENYSNARAVAGTASE